MQGSLQILNFPRVRLLNARRVSDLAPNVVFLGENRERAKYVVEQIQALAGEEPVDANQAEWIACLFGGDVDLFRELAEGDDGAEWRRKLRQAREHGETFFRFLAEPRRALADKVRTREPGYPVVLPGGERLSRIPGPEVERPLYRAQVGEREIWAATPEDLLDTLGFPPAWED